MAEKTLPGLKLFNRGKVRDIYDLGDKLLLVASDRISAFDVILPTLIPDKGNILTALSVYWFGVMQDIIPHHLITTNIDEFPAACQPHRAELEGRTMLVKKSLPAPVDASFEATSSVRGGRITNSNRTVCGIPLPRAWWKPPVSIIRSSRRRRRLQWGAHDVNITFDEMVGKVGKAGRGRRRRDPATTTRAREMAEKKGIIIADTKLEFGVEGDNIILIVRGTHTRLFRFWPADGYKPGKHRIASAQAIRARHLSSFTFPGT